MKSVISTLLLTTEFLIHFDESHAMEYQGPSSGSGDNPMSQDHSLYYESGWGGVRAGAGRKKKIVSDLENESQKKHRTGKIGRPVGSKTRDDGLTYGKFRISDYVKKPVRLTREPDKTVMIMDKNINIWLNERKDFIVQAEYPNYHCPAGHSLRKVNYLVRLVILRPPNEGIVECVHQNGTLLGVRPRVETSKNLMEPNPTQWFFIYEREVFRVRRHPETKTVKIILADRDENEVAQGVAGDPISMAGFQFRVIKLPPENIITGAVPFVLSPPTIVTNFRDLIC